jgi:glycine cleavage system regulatory protein
MRVLGVDIVIDAGIITGNVVVEVAQDGVVYHRQHFRNLVVDTGLNLVRDRLAGTSSAYVTHLAVGTSATAAAAGQTTLVAENFRNGLTETVTATTKAVTYKYYLSASESNGVTIREIGLFTASSGGTMVARAVLLSPIAKNTSTTVTFSWTLNLSAS